jgi:hypothetical protein
MRFYELITEAVAYDNAKFMARWQQEGFSYKDQIGADGENWVEWLAAQDPSKKKSYVNWMITRYISGGINRLEDIPARLVSALKIYDQAKITRKVKPEDADIGKFKKLIDFTQMVKNNYGEKEIASNKSIDSAQEQQFFADGEAELVYNTPEWKVVIPKTHAASCYFGRNTEWCTTTKDDPKYFDEHSKDGPLYIILQKKTNTRWQFHFESAQFMDENDEAINIAGFLLSYPEITKIFHKHVTIVGDLIRMDRQDGEVGYYNKKYLLHRTDGPAFIWPRGTKEWYLNDKRHRTDGPAVEYVDGDKEWWVKGKLHRIDGPAIERTDGSKEWYIKGKLHRIDGPAWEGVSGTKQWLVNGNLHRTDGPAVEHYDGSKSWWIADKRYSEENYNKKIAQMKAVGEI